MVLPEMQSPKTRDVGETSQPREDQGDRTTRMPMWGRRGLGRGTWDPLHSLLNSAVDLKLF